MIIVNTTFLLFLFCHYYYCLAIHYGLTSISISVSDFKDNIKELSFMGIWCYAGFIALIQLYYITDIRNFYIAGISLLLVGVAQHYNRDTRYIYNILIKYLHYLCAIITFISGNVGIYKIVGLKSFVIYTITSILICVFQSLFNIKDKTLKEQKGIIIEGVLLWNLCFFIINYFYL